MTAEGAQQFGQAWRITPTVPLRDLIERGPTLMMPMAGEEVELRLPDGHVMMAHIASFGIDAWKDSEGNLYTNSDPSDPSLTLTITCDADVTDIPSGTEIWLPNAKSQSET
jgi:hypothetical protein